jgi:hypothetical protein
MGRWIRRSIWCVVLGFATAWLVAWGVTVAMWGGWYRPSPKWIGKGVGVVEPWLLEMELDQRAGFEGESWNGDRLDREGQIGEHNRRRADRVLEIGGAAFAEEHRPRVDEMRDWYTEFEAQRGWEQGTIIKNYREMLAVTQRIDDRVASFPPAYLASRMASTQADTFFIYAQRFGWPIPMLESVGGFEATFSESGFQTTDVEESHIKIDGLQRSAFPGMPPQSLSLPIGVLVPATLANTVFYAVSWFAVFTGLELLRSLRRRMAGQCVRCGYDLRRVVGSTCPECGRTKK